MEQHSVFGMDHQLDLHLVCWMAILWALGKEILMAMMMVSEMVLRLDPWTAPLTVHHWAFWMALQSDLC
jgi:hypothetical protein